MKIAQADDLVLADSPHIENKLYIRVAEDIAFEEMLEVLRKFVDFDMRLKVFPDLQVVQYPQGSRPKEDNRFQVAFLQRPVVEDLEPLAGIALVALGQEDKLPVLVDFRNSILVSFHHMDLMELAGVQVLQESAADDQERVSRMVVVVAAVAVVDEVIEKPCKMVVVH